MDLSVAEVYVKGKGEFMIRRLCTSDRRCEKSGVSADGICAFASCAFATEAEAR